MFAIFNGDMVDGDHHNTSQIMSRNPEAQAAALRESLAVPLALNLDKLFVVRGTEAHTGKFREDLLYRLGVIHVTLPALRERGCRVDVVLGARRVDLHLQQVAPRLGQDLREPDGALELRVGGRVGPAGALEHHERLECVRLDVARPPTLAGLQDR